MTRRWGRGLREKRCLLALVVIGSLPLACAERIGSKAAEGAMKTMREEANNPTGTPASQIAAERAVKGAIDVLDDPEQQARIQKMVAASLAAATRTMVDVLDDPEQQARIQKMVSASVAAATRTMVEDASAQLVAELGADGRGPLAVSLSQVGAQVSASVADGAVRGVVGRMGSELDSLAPECSGPNRSACLEQRFQDTARRTAASFSKGVHDTIGWQFLLLAFALGAAGGALGSWLWSLRVARRSWRTA
jgi:hypothetical protein